MAAAFAMMMSFLVEQIRNGAGCGHVASILAKSMANFADRAVAIVGVDLEQNGDAAGAVALELKFFVGGAGEFAGAALDGALDVVLRHVLGLGGENGAAEARVGVGIAAAVLGGNADFLDQAGKNLAPLGVKRALLMLDGGPF